MSRPVLSSGLLVVATTVTQLLTGCASDVPQTGVLGRIQLTVSPLSLPNLEDACYSLSVSNEALGTVWSESGICASKYGAAGGLTFVGSCDATDFDGGGSTNTVTLTIDDLYSAPGVVLNDYQDPCAAPHNPAGCKLTVPCVENSDTPVTFNLAILREANQGFFDVAVNFDDIFCSAKLDCEQAPGVPLTLLHNPSTGQRAQTAVVALACTTGPNEVGTVLLREPITVTCGGTTTVLDPGRTRGNVYGNGAGQMADPNPADAIWQYAIYAGDEALNCGGVSCKKQYWNVAIGFDPTASNCVLTTQATAIEGTSGATRTPPANTVWPVIDYNVRLTSNSTPGTLACSRHPLNVTPTGVSTTYSSPTAPVEFDVAFDGDNFYSSLPVVLTDLRLLVDPSNPLSVSTSSSKANDLSGNNFHGTFRGPTGAETVLGSLSASVQYDTSDDPDACLNFVGVGDSSQGYIQWAGHPLAGYSSYSIETWFKVPSLTPVAEYNVVFYSSAPDSSFQEFGLIVQNSQGDPDVAVEINNDYTGGSSGVRVDLNWNHIVFAYDGNIGRVYVNGVLSFTRDFPDANTLQSTGWNWIGVGQWANSSYNGAHGYTQGKLGYLALYGKSLTVSEIQQNYNALRTRFGR